MKALDKAIVMGANIDGKVLRDAAMAHHKALGSMDSKLVTTAADYQAVNAGIGKMIASVPSSRSWMSSMLSSRSYPPPFQTTCSPCPHLLRQPQPGHGCLQCFQQGRT